MSDEDITLLYRQGMTVTELFDSFECSINQLEILNNTDIIREHHVSLINRIRCLKRNELPLNAISKQLGIPVSSVKKYLENM